MTQEELYLAEQGSKDEIINFLIDRDGYTYEELEGLHKCELVDLI